MNDLVKLTNPEFELEFDGASYRVRKANLGQAVEYQQKIKELTTAKDPAMDLKLAAFCIYLVLRNKIDNLTEKDVLDKTPADIEVIDVLITLGFINPKKATATKLLQKAVVDKLTSVESSPTSPSAPGGAQTP